MRILVTGSSGHLGEGLIRTLSKQNHQLIGLDILESPFTNVVGSITDQKLVRQLMKGVDAVFHTATLHKPHIVTHTKQDFIEVNVSGTLNLLEAAKTAGVESFIFTSTTSTFGDAMKSNTSGNSAVWVTEALQAIPKNIYGVTKIAAEGLCKLFSRNHGLACIILRTARFFQEEDDRKDLREAYDDTNIKVNEFLYRRADIKDIVSAHLLALEKAPELRFGTYIISATTPFTESDLPELGLKAPKVLLEKYPNYVGLYQSRNWKMFPSISRVYVNEKARKELNWQPKYDFEHILKCLSENKDYRSTLAKLIDMKGYHDEIFEEGPYPV